MDIFNELTSASYECKIVTTRTFNAPRALMFQAWRERNHLINWWGPNGFTNTFHEFDFEQGGKWSYDMYDQNGSNYLNECLFLYIEDPEYIIWDHTSDPKFKVLVAFEEVDGGKTTVTFTMVFPTREACDQLKYFITPKNEESFDRLEKELQTMQNL